jgi:hypothetical protein
MEPIPKEVLEQQCVNIANTALAMGYITKVLKKDGRLYAVYVQWPGDDEPLIYLHPSQMVPDSEEKGEYPSLMGEVENFVEIGDYSGGISSMIIYNDKLLRYIIECSRYEVFHLNNSVHLSIIGLAHPKAQKAFHRWENEYGYTIHDWTNAFAQDKKGEPTCQKNEK